MRAVTLLASIFVAFAVAGCVEPATTTPDQMTGSPPDQSTASESDLGVADLAIADSNDVPDIAMEPGCLPGMARIDNFCVDRWEAHVVEISDAGTRPHSPFVPVDDMGVRAETAPNVMPQAYINQVEAAAACKTAGKRLCTAAEFALACRGPDANNYYPYGGTTHIAKYCNEGKGSSMPLFFGTDSSKWTYANFNDPRLNQWDGGLAPTASYPHCVSPTGVYDCVGNLHEWGAEPPDSKGHSTFRGGFYGDAEINGHGCLYYTVAHVPTYHDYSTGFRCCMDAN
jgi:hypothetical protein